MTTWTIRAAQAGDAVALSALAEHTFRATFAASNSQSDLALHCAQTYSPALQRAELERSGLHTLLVENNGALLGFAQLQPGGPVALVGGAAPIELRRFYLLAAWHGTGLARALMGAVAARALAAQADCIWLGVWEHNPRAIAFYRKLGFSEVGAQTFLLGSDPQRDLVMAAATSTVQAATGGA